MQYPYSKSIIHHCVSAVPIKRWLRDLLLDKQVIQDGTVFDRFTHLDINFDPITRIIMNTRSK